MDKIEKYEMMIHRLKGVLYLEGKPGSAKSSIFRYIAERNNGYYIDLRLSQMDSAEVGGIPRTKFIEDGTEIMYYAIPEWAYEANFKAKDGQKVYVHMEELNRASKEVQDAALQPLNERMLGHKFHFHENVYFVASGNLGEEDGCEINEFDAALWNRLRRELHELDIDTWEKHFANENVNKYIINFLKAKPMWFFYRKEGDKNFATPRTWTDLSYAIGKDEKDINKIIDIVDSLGLNVVGSASKSAFITYLQESKSISIDMVLKNYSKIQETVKELDRSRINELLQNLKEIKLDSLSETKEDNMILFLKDVYADARLAFLDWYIDKNAIPDIECENIEDVESFDPVFTKQHEKIKDAFYSDIEYLIKNTTDSIEESSESKE